MNRCLNRRRPPRNWHRWTRLGLAAAMLLLVTGCPGSSPPAHHRSTFTVETRRDDLTAALNFIGRFDEFEAEQAQTQIIYHLNQWMVEQSRDANWKPDPMLARLPRALVNLPSVRRVSDPTFAAEDVSAIRESFWMRRIAGWVSQQKDDPELEQWVAETQSGLSRDDQTKLLLSARLFDWTVRNIQQDVLLAYPKGPVAGPGIQANRPGELPPPLRGEMGPGYAFLPWQILLYGHGDALGRARIFIHLARQLDVDVVMLAIEDPTTTPRYQPWLPAVLIDDQLYLFDSALGLPIPGPDSRGVATLEQIVADPGLLASLTIDAEHAYGVSAADLDKVVALIDAAPQFLSQRMRVLEDHLTGDDKLILALAPAHLDGLLRQCKWITNVGLWNVPFEACGFRDFVDGRLRDDRQFRAAYSSQFGLFMSLNPLVQGRYRHLKGEFDDTDDRQGARSMYMQLRLSQETLDNLESSPDAQRQLGLIQGPRESNDEFQMKLAAARIFFTGAKMHASFWMGLIHYENGEYQVARDWFQKLCLDAMPESPFTPGTRYNLARCLEQLGDYAAARELYLSDQSPQELGNRLRARRLAERLGSPAATSSGENHAAQRK